MPFLCGSRERGWREIERSGAGVAEGNIEVMSSEFRVQRKT
jgi:hypothetical protein